MLAGPAQPVQWSINPDDPDAWNDALGRNGRFTWTRFPCVLKAGHCHGGKATAKLDNPGALQDAAGLLCGTGLSDNGSYCSLEPYIDAKFDVHIQKIGTSYKAFMRKSISGNWKTNQGSAMLEQIPMTEKYKTWVDEVSELFGGMEVCGVAVIVSKEGKEFIISAADSTFPLMGDTQEEDRRQIADLVVGRMQNVCRPSMMTKAVSRSSISSRGTSPTEDAPPVPIGTRPVPVGGGPPPIPERTTPGVGSIGRHGSFSSQSGEPPEQPSERAPTLNSVGRRDSQASQSSSVSGVSSASAARSGVGKVPPAAGAGPGGPSVVEDAEDTMKNLRKTFAGIFGDISSTAGSATGSVLSTRESSIDSVLVRPAAEPTEKPPNDRPPPVHQQCNGAPGQPYIGAAGSGSAITASAPSVTSTTAGSISSSVHKVNVSSLDGTSASTSISISSGSSNSSGQSTSAEPKRPAYDPALSERINPFDKEARIAGTPGRSASVSGATGHPTSSKITTNDDTARYTIQQGIREQPSLTGRFQAPAANAGLGAAVVPPPVTLPATGATGATTASSATSFSATSSSSAFSSSTVSSFSASGSSGYSSVTSGGLPAASAPVSAAAGASATVPTSEQRKQEFGRTKRASSDAEIIFGDRGPDFFAKRYERAGGEFRQRTESLTDAELIFGTSAVTGPAAPTPPNSAAPFSPAASSTGSAAGRYGTYGSRDSASFSSTTTSDTEFVYGRKDPSMLTKSMSVASDRSASAGRPWARPAVHEDEEELDLK
uniref:Synapsin ATP-binding domain-containing protein n=1 Tax=Anopheles quadriannulatus TaxID=34691 RepID=A0A182XKG3_ANOQN